MACPMLKNSPWGLRRVWLGPVGDPRKARGVCSGFCVWEWVKLQQRALEGRGGIGCGVGGRLQGIHPAKGNPRASWGGGPPTKTPQ